MLLRLASQFLMVVAPLFLLVGCPRDLDLCKDQGDQQCCVVQTGPGQGDYASQCKTATACTAWGNEFPKNGIYPITKFPVKNSYTGTEGCR
jgi:hypothetical protein